MEIYNKTKSFCPECKKVLDTNIVEENDSMFMDKKCPEHGNFKIKVAKRAWYYKGLSDYYNNLFPKDSLQNKRQQTYTNSITAKCNSKCPICFADSPLPKKEDLSLDFIKDQLSKIKNKGLNVHFSGGGEPTLRDDLPEMIRLTTESGNNAGILTNGIRIANDFEYLKKLKEGGVEVIYTWMDTIKNPAIYKKMRGQDFIESKKKFVENMKKLKIPIGIIPVIARGINESEIGDLIDYARKEETVHNLFFKSYNHMGGCAFTPNAEFLIDEFVETVANQSNNLFTLEDIYCYQKILFALSAINKELPLCFQTVAFSIPREKEKPLRDIFRFDKISKILDEFGKIWQEDQKGAEKYFLSKCFPWFKLFFNPDLYRLHQVMKKTRTESGGRIPHKHYLLLPCKHYLVLFIQSMNNVANYDIERIQQSCVTCSFNRGVENNISRCYDIMNS